MTNDKTAEESYRKLVYFFENKIKVHFKDLDEIFYNGLIIDLNNDKKTMVLDERMKGMIPILLEFINPDSIRKFEVRGWISVLIVEKIVLGKGVWIVLKKHRI